MSFQKAVRKRAKLRLALSGPSGSGKTHGALLIAKGLGGKIAMIDTERGSASLYSDLVEFDTLEIAPPFAPERFIGAIHAAASAGYDVCIIDSITHEWDGAGGCLEINDTVAQAKFRGNTWAAWNETTPRHRAFLDAILQAPMHIIATMRSKTETVQGEDKKVKRLGMKAVQREGAEYEFTVVLDLEHGQHYANSSKDRTNLFHEPHIITAETGQRIAAWLDSGAVVVVPERQAPPAQQPERAGVDAGDDMPGPPTDRDPVSIATRLCNAWRDGHWQHVRDLWKMACESPTLKVHVWAEIKLDRNFADVNVFLKS
jgi:hypothetical protein